MSSEIKTNTISESSSGSGVTIDGVKLKDSGIESSSGSRVLASDSGSAWSWGANVPKGSVIEQFASPCDGSAITVQSGTYTIENVTAVQQMTEVVTAVTGSTIDYTPPSGTQTVVYAFHFMKGRTDNNGLLHGRMMLDNDSGTLTLVTNSKSTWFANTDQEIRVSMRWAFHIGGSNNDDTGRRATWDSARTISFHAKEYGSSNQAKVHETNHFDGTGDNVFSQPVIEIIALA